MSLLDNVRLNRSPKKRSALVKSCLERGPTSFCQNVLLLTVSIYGELTGGRQFSGEDVTAEMGLIFPLISEVL